MARPVLVLNAGSSSLKYQVVDPGSGESRLRGLVERVDEVGFGPALEQLAAEVADHGLTERDLLAVGHRVVHGGARYTAATLLDDSVVSDLDELSRLAPLHNPPAVEGIRRARSAYPDLPQLAVFDTAFFVDLPAAARTYAIDADLAEREGIRRHGMHGTSHQYVAGEAARLLGRDLGEVDLIVLHLGNGASASAIHHGRPVETSMGFTPLEGLVMGTRGGDLDPGVLLHLLRHGHSVDDLDDLLHHRSGLQGLAGVPDSRDVEAAMHEGDARARAAHEVTCHRIRKYVGAYLAVLGRCDAIVFTAGVGEHSADVRADSLSGLGRLGIEVDARRNAGPGAGARVISPDGAEVAVLVVPTNEELAIARQVAAALER